MRTKVASLRSAADSLSRQGYDELAALISAIATAHDQVRRTEPISLEEALRWSPVVAAAVRFTEGLDR